MRALGTRHSFNDLADNGATLVTVTGIAAEPVLDEAARTVTVGAGISYGALAGWLQQRGWALHNLGSLPHISVAGATATGTHGSGSRNRILSAAIAGLEYVDADGELRRAGRADPGFDGMAVGLGAFGVVVRVTLDVQPTYLVRQDVYAGPEWDRVLADLDDIMSAAYSVSLFTDWSGDSIQTAWVKRRLDGRKPDGTPAPPEFFGARRDPGPVRLVDAPVDNLTVVGAAGPWSERLPHFRIDSPPSNGDEIQSEYFIDRGRGAAALDAVRRLSPLITPLLLVSEIRATAPDRLWLSGSYDRETARPPLHLAQPPGPGQRRGDRGRGGAGAVRRPAALGEGHRTSRRASPNGCTPGWATRGRCSNGSTRRPVQQPPPRAAGRPRDPADRRLVPARSPREFSAVAPVGAERPSVPLRVAHRELARAVVLVAGLG